MIIVRSISNINFLDKLFLYIPTIINYKIFQPTKCFRFAKLLMNNPMLINPFHSDNCNVAKIKTEYHQIITPTTNNLEI